MVLMTEIDDIRIAIITWEIDEPSDLLDDLKEIDWRCNGYITVTESTMEAMEEYADMDSADMLDLETIGIPDGKLGLIDVDIIKANFSKVWKKIESKLEELDD